MAKSHYFIWSGKLLTGFMFFYYLTYIFTIRSTGNYFERSTASTKEEANGFCKVCLIILFILHLCIEGIVSFNCYNHEEVYDQQ